MAGAAGEAALETTSACISPMASGSAEEISVMTAAAAADWTSVGAVFGAAAHSYATSCVTSGSRWVTVGSAASMPMAFTTMGEPDDAAAAMA